MAGTSTDFNAADFIANIEAAMMMGLPDDEAMRPIFHFDGARTYDYQDGAHRPWDPKAATATDPAPAAAITAGTVDGLPLCAVDPREGETDETTAGTFEADEYILVFLQNSWDMISDFTWVELGGKRFKRGKTVAPLGLFPVTVWQTRVEADPDA